MTALVDTLPMVMRADDVLGPKQGCWTYDDYAAIPEDRHRYEVIAGVLYMSPSPRTAHQRAVLRIILRVSHYVEARGLGEAFVAPFDVELAPHTVVQPDAIVVLAEHMERVTTSHVVGAPDLVVEVSSPSTAGHDRREKQDAYARAGVPEYWIVDPLAETVELLLLEGAEYQTAGLFQGQATLPSKIVPELPVHVADFFA